jgi:TolB-like protein
MFYAKETIMKKTYLLLITILMALLLPAALFAQKKESLAVFSLTGGSVSDGEAIASSLTRQTSLRNAFNKTTLINRNTIAAMNFEQRFQRDGLTDSDTIFELGKQLNASHVIAGYITRLGNSNLVLVSVMDIESLQQIAGDYRTYNSIDEIDRIIPEIAQKLAAGVTRNTGGLPGLSVPPFNVSNGVNQNDAMVLPQILACELANGNRYAVLPRTDSLNKVMEEHQRQRSGVTDQERIRRLGAGRNAKYVLSGSVERLGSTNKFTADILDIADGSFVDGQEERYTSFSQGFELIPRLAFSLNEPGLSAAFNDEKPVKANEFEKYLLNIKTARPGNYTITLTEDVTLNTSIDLKGFENKTITIQGDTQRRTITKNFNGLMFSIPKDVVLILGNNLTLNCNLKVGHNPYGDVYIDDGKLEMQNGAAISNGVGTAVFVRGIFNMAGGTISGGSTGVNVSGGNSTFNMTGGNINDNRGIGVDLSRGTFNFVEGDILNNKKGGVSVSNGTFNMTGGTIRGNTEWRGAGVNISGSSIFNMSGGIIGGNIAESYGNGGGVYVSGGIFIKTGGTIDDTNNAKEGKAVFVERIGMRNSTAGPSVNLDSRVNGSQGGWE